MEDMVAVIPGREEQLVTWLQDSRK